MFNTCRRRGRSHRLRQRRHSIFKNLKYSRHQVLAGDSASETLDEFTLYRSLVGLEPVGIRCQEVASRKRAETKAGGSGRRCGEKGETEDCSAFTHITKGIGHLIRPLVECACKDDANARRIRSIPSMLVAKHHGSDHRRRPIAKSQPRALLRIT